MLRRRNFLISFLYSPAAAAITTASFRIIAGSVVPAIFAQDARAQGRGGGNGNGGNGGGHGGNGGGNGNGNGGGGKGGDNGNGPHGGKGAGAGGHSRGARANPGKGNVGAPGKRHGRNDDETVVRSTDQATVVIAGPTIEVRYQNGFKETVENGHYIMKDAQGRTIIDRAATGSDRARLRGMVD